MSHHTHPVRLGLESLEDRLALDATTFVQTLYDRVLHRAGGAAEVSGWVAAVNRGADPLQVEQAFLNSLERRGHQVDDLYQGILHRSADAGGRDAWARALQAGLTIGDAATAFLTSAEYRNSHASDDSFVRGLYQDVLHRAADDSGLAGWKGYLAAGGSRALATAAIFGSREHYQQLVAGTYTEFLHRGGTAPEHDAWATVLMQNGGRLDVTDRSILGSHEFEVEVEFEFHGGGHP